MGLRKCITMNLLAPTYFTIYSKKNAQVCATRTIPLFLSQLYFDMIKYIFRKIHEAWGWRVEGFDHKSIPKKIFVVLPHTSNWDFPVGYMLKVFDGMDVRWIAKASLFRFPFGWLMKSMGGIPVNRKQARNFVPTMIELYEKNEVFSTAIAPEGTRKKVDKLKSGYYRIASGANIPVIYTKFDWENMIVHFGEPRMAADTWEEECAYAMDYFADVVGRVPENSIGYPFTKKGDTE